MNEQSEKQTSGGKKTDWDATKEQTDLPIITIITSTYNVINDLPWTMESIKKQTYPYIQWIVADGASSDGTVELLQKYSDVIDYWFSAPDTGIYDAWNKALDYIKGDWVQFLGAGDELYEPITLDQVSKHLADAYPKYDLVYGKVQHISEAARETLYISGRPWNTYQSKWSTYGRPELPEHPGIFHHKSTFNQTKFDSSLQIAADSMFLLSQLKIKSDMLYVDIIVDKMVYGGVSSSFLSFLTIYEETQYMQNTLNFKPPYKTRVIGSCKYYTKKNLVKAIGIENTKKVVDGLRMLLGKKKVWTVHE